MLRRADHACNDLIFREVKIPLPCTRRLNIPLNIDTTRPNIRGDCAHFGSPCHYDVEKKGSIILGLAIDMIIAVAANQSYRRT